MSCRMVACVVLAAWMLLTPSSGQAEPPSPSLSDLESEVARQRDLDDPSSLAAAMRAVSDHHYHNGDLARVAEWERQRLDILLAGLGRGHLQTAIAMSELAEVLMFRGESVEAMQRITDAMPVLQAEPVADAKALVNALTTLATLHHGRREHERSEQRFAEAIRIGREALGVNHPATLEAMNNLGNLLIDTGDYLRAQQVFEQTSTARRETLGALDPATLTTMNNLAELWVKLGDYDRALALRSSQLAAVEGNPQIPPQLHAATLNNLGLLRLHMGDFIGSERALQRGLDVARVAWGDHHPNTLGAINNLVALHRKRGNYDDAEQWAERLLQGMESTEISPALRATAHNNLAIVRWVRGDLEAATASMEKVVALHRGMKGSEADLGTAYASLGALFTARGQPTRGERWGRHGLALVETALGPTHPLTARVVRTVAGLVAARGDLAQAQQLYSRAFATSRDAYGEEHPTTATAKIGVAHMHWAQGDTAGAIEALTDGLAREHRHLRNSGLAVDASDILEATVDYRARQSQAISLHLQLAPDDASAARLAATTVLQRKARVADLLASRNAVRRRTTTDGEPRTAWLEVRAAEAAYAAPMAAVGGDDLTDAARQTLEDARTRLRRARSALARAVNQPPVEPGAVDVTLADVSATLGPHTVLIELARYQPFDPDPSAPQTWGPARYAAYLLRSNELDWVDLGPAQPIDAKVEAVREALARRWEAREPIRALSQLVVDPLLERIPAAPPDEPATLIISADGLLGLVPFAALTDRSGRYLVERFDLRAVATGRDLLPRPDPPGQRPAAASHRVTMLGDPPGADLPGAARELAALREHFAHVDGWLGPDASEERLRNLRDPWILHIVAHGVFDTGTEGHRYHEIPLPPTPGRPGAVPRARNRWAALDDPMLHSGLELAATEGHEGRVTAYELSSLDLQGTELVILSGCETGLGLVQEGEGILGLRRGLAIAGVQTQLMSLWRISDEATPELLRRYFARIAGGEDLVRAYRSVQREMIVDERFSHPHYWAQFVPLGRSGPLSLPPPPPPAAASPSEPPTRGCRCGPGRHDRTPGWLAALVLLGLVRRPTRRGPAARQDSPRAVSTSTQGFEGWDTAPSQPLCRRT